MDDDDEVMMLQWHNMIIIIITEEPMNINTFRPTKVIFCKSIKNFMGFQYLAIFLFSVQIFNEITTNMGLTRPLETSG